MIARPRGSTIHTRQEVMFPGSAPADRREFLKLTLIQSVGACARSVRRTRSELPCSAVWRRSRFRGG